MSRQLFPTATVWRRASPATPAQSLFAAVLLATCTFTGAASVWAEIWEAPLDTLEIADQPPPWIPQDLQISRRVLPQITATRLPPATAPERPPRLDDPLEAAFQFHQARQAQAAGDDRIALKRAGDAVRLDPTQPAYAWWLAWRALRSWDLSFVDAVSRAVRATHADLPTWKRLQLVGHSVATLWLALLWTLLAAAYLFRYGGHIGHDLTAWLLRDPAHRPRRWGLPLLLLALFLLRPGWFVWLALISGMLYVHTHGRARALLVTVWLLNLGALYPGWLPLRAAMPAVDPASETSLLSRADVMPPTAGTIREGEARLENVGADAARAARLRLALGMQAARAGDYIASNRLLEAILAYQPTNVAALVNLANNNYYLGRYDKAVEGYLTALQHGDRSGAVYYNLAQAYNRKLFFKESTDALAQAATLGFVPLAWEDKAGAANGFTPVVMFSHDRADLEASARWEAKAYPALAHLTAWAPWLGERVDWWFWQLLGVFTLSITVGLWLPSAHRSVACLNCGTVICSGCGTSVEDDLLCSTCASTAERARSEVVLATLLKNRSRDLELAFIARARRFNRILPGASNLVAGSPIVGLARLSLVAVGLCLALFGWAIDLTARWDLPGLLLPEESVHPTLLPLPAHAWSGPGGWSMLAGALLLAATYTTAWLAQDKFRRSRPARLPVGILRTEVRTAPPSAPQPQGRDAVRREPAAVQEREADLLHW